MGALSLCSLCECDLGLYMVSLLSALGPFVGSYLRSPATQWCGTRLMPDRKLPWCLLMAHRATCWVTFHILERKELRCQRGDPPPMFPSSQEWVRTASMRVCARSKGSEICLCLQFVSLTATVLPEGWRKAFRACTVLLPHPICVLCWSLVNSLTAVLAS